MPIVNELVTVLRYQVDDEKLTWFQRTRDRLNGWFSKTGNYARSIGTAMKEGLVEGVREGVAAHRQLNVAQQKANVNARQLSNTYSEIGTHVRGILAAIGVMKTADIADEWAGVNARVSLAVAPDEYQTVLDRIFGISQNSGQQYTSTADLFQKVARNQGELGIGTDQSLQLTDIIGKAMTIGGGSKASQDAALMQLGQSLGAGVLRGDELNSIIEQAPRLAQSIAESFGTTVGKLKDLGQAGKLTSKELAAGLLKQAQKIDAEFEKMPKTFSRGITVMQNAYGKLVDQINRASKASEIFYSLSKFIADNMERIAAVGAFAVVAYGLEKLRGVGIKTLAPFLRMAAILWGIYLIGEDLMTWYQGGASIFGSLFGERAEWNPLIDDIRDFVDWLRKAMKDNSGSVGQFLLKWASIGAITLVLLRGLWMLSTPLVYLGEAFLWIGGILVGLVGWPALLAAAFVAAGVLIYAYWDDIEAYVKGIWDSTVTYFSNLWKQALQEVADLARKILPEKWFLSRDQNPDIKSRIGQNNPVLPLGDGLKQMAERYGVDIQSAGTVGSVSQNNQINNNININANTNNPAALGNAAAGAVGEATTRSIPTPGRPSSPNVEVAP